MSEQPYDLAIIGAGINGAGVARDAALRGLRVLICEAGDIAGATSWASTKLIHGGLRYLEHYAFALVREALAEREVMLHIAPHLTREQRFIIPHTPAQRPAWLLRLGLFLYDLLAGGQRLASSEGFPLDGSPYAEPLRAELRYAFAYSDLATDDARLTLANVLAAVGAGARFLPRTRLAAARRDGPLWRVEFRVESGACVVASTRVLVNAAGPWVKAVREGVVGEREGASVRLVKGSHIVVPRQYAGSHAYLFQNDDGRIGFAIPYERDFLLIGTTEVALTDPDTPVTAGRDECAYLCRLVSRYFCAPLRPEDVVWSFAGMRALYDDGSADPSTVTREYRLLVDALPGEAPLLSVFGGKLTTYRRLAERVLEGLKPWLPRLPPPKTAILPLPGGDLPSGGLSAFQDSLVRAHPNLPSSWLRALARRHGSLAREVIAEAQLESDLGRHFGGGLYEREVIYFIQREWACRPEDVLWRRSKCGLRMTQAERADFSARFVDLFRRAGRGHPGDRAPAPTP